MSILQLKMRYFFHTWSCSEISSMMTLFSMLFLMFSALLLSFEADIENSWSILIFPFRIKSIMFVSSVTTASKHSEGVIDCKFMLNRNHLSLMCFSTTHLIRERSEESIDFIFTQLSSSQRMNLIRILILSENFSTETSFCENVILWNIHSWFRELACKSSSSVK